MNERRWQWVGLALAAALVIPGALLAGPPRHRPGFTIALASTTPSGSSTTLRYHAWVSPGHRINPHDFFRVNDLAYYVEGSAQAPAGWTAATELTSPAVTTPGDDDPAVPNLVFTYNGREPIAGPVLLPGFSARTTSGSPRTLRGFVGRTTRSAGPTAGTKVVSAGVVRPPGTVPEPASLFSACLGVIVLGTVYACRHRSRLRVAV